MGVEPEEDEVMLLIVRDDVEIAGMLHDPLAAGPFSLLISLETVTGQSNHASAPKSTGT